MKTLHSWLAVAIISCCCLPAFGQTPVANTPLAYSFKEGETFRYSAETQIKFGTDKLPMSQEILVEYTIRVKSLVDGKAKVNAPAERIRIVTKMQVGMLPAQEQGYDTKTKKTIGEAKPESFAKAQEQIGKEYVAEITPQGQIVDTTGTAEDRGWVALTILSGGGTLIGTGLPGAYRPPLGLMFPPLPKEPVKKGQTWKAKFQELDFIVRYDGTEDRGDRRLHKLTLQPAGPFDEVTAKLVDKMEATVWIDPEAGRTVEARFVLTRPPLRMLRNEMTVTIKLVP